MQHSQAIVYHRHGDPLEVLELVDRPMPEPGAGAVRIKLLAACVHPSDFGKVAGSYGRLEHLPAVAGREALGEVEAIGAGVTGVALGTRVRFPEAGAWQEYACCQAAALELVPEGIAIANAAQSFINPPTAYCLLEKLMDLPKGAWVLQNAGNSAVGLCIIQLAKELGYRTISEVRRESLEAPLKALGADKVVFSGSGWHRQIEEITAGAPLALALNSVGGESALDQLRALRAGGTQVTFGGMVRQPVRFPTRELIFKDLRLRGFWWDSWVRENGPKASQEIVGRIHQWMREGRLQLALDQAYPMDQYKEAISRAAAPRLGKVLLAPDPKRLAEEA